MSNPVANGSRRRKPAPSVPSDRVPPGIKQINAAPSLENAESGFDRDRAYALSKLVGSIGTMVHATLPALLSWGLTMGLIFGGCCSNVFALETIVKEEPQSGLLITFIQFLMTALFTWPAHFSASHSPSFLKPRAIPLARWFPNVILFFTVNILNNFAFSYNISVPVHIILRSGGSVTTMLVGFIWGKRYTQMQVFSVAMLTVGIIIAAMADARSKGKMSSIPLITPKSDPSFITGLLILALAQILSAIMGLYTQLTYAAYGCHWHENLFYSHFLSLPLFIPFLPSIFAQFRHLLTSQPIHLSSSFLMPSIPNSKLSNRSQQILSPIVLAPSWPTPVIPKHFLTLTLNALTQYACIRGVNLLGARTSALGVTIVLNVRKLVSLFASIWLFGNHLPSGVIAGAAVVFTSAGVWAWEGQRLAARSRGERKAQ